MAAPFFSTPFQPYVYQSQQDAIVPFQILGGEAQIVQIMLKHQDKITARPGSMCYMSGALQMESVYAPEIEGGLWQWLFGRNMTSTVIFNPVSDDGYVGIAAPSLARIIPIDLTNFGGELLCQPDAFLCSMGDVAVTNTVDQRGGRNAVITAEGILRQKLSGQGLAFVLAGGSVAQKILVPGEVLVVDTSCIVAMTNTLDFQIKYTGPIRRVVFGGENQVTAVLTGPGIIFIQSLPFYRLSQRVASFCKLGLIFIVMRLLLVRYHQGSPQSMFLSAIDVHKGNSLEYYVNEFECYIPYLPYFLLENDCIYLENF